MNTISTFFFRILLIIVLMVPGSCKNGDRSAARTSGDTAQSPEDLQSSSYEQIVLSREQFRSSDMKLGNPEIMRFQQSVEANGYTTASPGGKVWINPLFPGKITEISCSPGEKVKKGQNLFFIESNEIIQIQMDYAEAKSSLGLLESIYRRQELLKDENISAGKDFIRAESDYKGMVAKTEGLKARLKLANLDPQKVESGTIVSGVAVKSPIDGYITMHDLVLGQVAEPQQRLLEITDTDKLQLNIYVFEKDIALLTSGQQVNYYLPDRNSEVYQATLILTGKSVDSESKTIHCIAEMKAGDRNHFMDGSFVETEIITCQREALALPATALITEDAHHYVLIMIAETDSVMNFKKIPVRIGEVQGDIFELLEEGLHDVLIEGGYNLMGE